MGKRKVETILSDMRLVEIELSPENLHCDGEISMAAARRKKVKLRARWSKLVRELGREPTDAEIWECTEQLINTAGIPRFFN